MPAPNRHRKLIEYPTNGTATLPLCPIQCNPFENPTAVCSFECIPFCPIFCHLAEYSPTPSPATTPYATLTPPDHHHPPLSLPLKISLGFLIATFVYTLYKFYTVCCRSRPRRTPPPPENQETHDHHGFVEIDHPIWYIRTTGLQQSVINSLTVVKFSKVDGTVVEGTDCLVCLTEFEEGDTLRLLPNCKHAFHVSCIDTWLRSHTNCPLCRAVIVNNNVGISSSERNDDDSGVNGEIISSVLSIRDGDQGEASGSSGLEIGETDEDDRNDNLVK